jgi:hypothetical protein
MKIPTPKQMIVAGVVIIAVAGVGFILQNNPKKGRPSDQGKIVNSGDAVENVVAPDAPVITRNAGTFANGQPYASYKKPDFEAIYPDWPSAPASSATGTESWQVFVQNQGCNVIIRPVKVAAGVTYTQYVENTLKEAEPYNPVFNRKEITNTTAIIDADISIGNGTIRNISYNFLSSKGISYGVAFVAEKQNFDAACQPYVDEVVKSVVVR